MALEPNTCKRQGMNNGNETLPLVATHLFNLTTTLLADPSKIGILSWAYCGVKWIFFSLQNSLEKSHIVCSVITH